MAKYTVLRAVPEICTGCRICEVVCSLKHTGTVNPYRARIRVERSDPHGVCRPVFCRHCEVPFCQEACPVPAAMYRNERTGAIVINESACNGCSACAEACPDDAIQTGPGGEILKCDLCDGNPVCVKYCPAGPAKQFPHVSFAEASSLNVESRGG